MSLMKGINTTEKELAYRNKHFHDIRVVKDREIACASCGNELIIKSGHVFSHPLLGLLQCETCRKHFKDTEEAFQKQSFCFICGQHKKLYICSDKDCSSAFCKYCIKRNSTLSLLDAEHKDWKCFVCKSRPLWDLRAVCAAVMNTIPKRCNRSNFQSIRNRTLPSQKEKREKIERVQRTLRALCDEEDDSNSEPRPSFSVKFAKSAREANNKDSHRPQPLEIHIINSSDMTSESEEDKPIKTKRSTNVKPISSSRDSSSSSQASVSKSVVIREDVSRKNKDFSDSDDSFIVSDEATAKPKRIKKSRTKFKENQSKKSHLTNTSDSDSDSDQDCSTSRASKTFGSSSRHTTQQNKKKEATSRNVRTVKNKVKNYRENSESEDENDIRDTKQRKGKHSGSHTISHNNNKEQKHERRNNSNSESFQKTREDNSDSSSKEFQKEKLLRSKYSSVKRLKDLGIDYTKPPTVENLSSEKITAGKDDDEHLNITFDHVKEVLKECKSMCSSFQKYIEIIEGLYEKEDEEQLILISAQKVNKLTTMLNKKQKDLTTFCKLWSKKSKGSKRVSKEVQKEVSRDERSRNERSSETDTHIIRKTHEDTPHNSENKRDSKEVSECDSEEIFSADESRKMRSICDTDVLKNDSSRVPSDADATDDEDKQQTNNKSKNSEKSNENLRAASPVLGTSEQKKASVEGSNKQLIPECANDNTDNKVHPKNKNIGFEITRLGSDNSNNCEDENDVDNFSSEQTNEKTTLQDNKAPDDPSTSNYIVNESIDDLFNDSSDDFDNVEDTMHPREANAETKSDGAEPTLQAESTNNIIARETSPNDKADCAAADTDKASSFERNEKEVDSVNHNGFEEMESATNNEKSYDVDDNLKQVTASEETDFNDVESAEKLAKRTLLESDFDNTTNDSQLDASLTKESSIVDNLKKSETEDIDSDSSTLIVPGPITNKNTTNDTDDKAEANTINKSKYESNKNTRDETTSSSEDEDENVKAEKAAKTALLACSNSDDSTLQSPLQKLEEVSGTKKSELDTSAIANIKAKKALLESSNTENSSSDVQMSETDTKVSDNSKKNKRNREPDSDSNSIISAVKRRRLHLRKNYHYLNDEKLRMTCEVRLTRLSKKILKRYSQALQKSKQFLEHKALKSLVNLDKLEKRHRNTRKDSDASTSDDNASSKISRRSNKGKGKQTMKETEESLMDHLKKVENNDPSGIQTIYSSDESIDQVTKVDAPVSNEALLLEADRTAKQNLLNSSDSETGKALVNDNSTSSDDKSEETEDKKKKSQKKTEEIASKQNEIKKEKSGKSNWRRDKILTMNLSDTDSDAEREKWNKKQEQLIKKEERDNSDSNEGKEFNSQKKKKKKKKGARRILDSDSDIKLTDCDSDSDNSSDASNAKKNSSASVISLDSVNTKKEKEKLKRRRKRRDSKSPKPKRKRIKKMASDSDSSDDLQTSQGTPGKSGRKNIRKVLKDKQVAEDTKQAAKEEEERLKRIAERQALYNEMYEMRLAGEEKLDKLVLDFDTETKEELVSVHEDLVKRLKPHQAQGIKFMWDACFESLERIKSTSGSGCIIAHCMGLGKTLQVIALTHTLLTHETTGIKTILVVCPLSTVLNWAHEYKTWLADLDDDVNVYELTKFKKNIERKYQLQRWQKTGGVLIIGYEMFRNLTGANKNIRKGMKEAILECLVNPGPDLIVCDEGHLLKNEDTALSKCIRMVKTMRRIVLTGTPLQNNLIEYHCMVQFVKPNLLGTKKEFLNRFVNPITNGQFDDSTAYDVKLMKKRAHVLHKMLEGSVQRFDYSVLTPFLPPKQEYVIFVRLTETQIKMYQYYLTNLARRHHGSGGSLFADFQALQRVWTHPVVLRLNAEKIEKANEKKDLSSESEGSLKDFINDDTTEPDSSSSESSNDSDVQAIDDMKDTPKRKTRNNPGVEEEPEPLSKEAPVSEVEWWSQFVQPEHFEDIKVSAKLLLLFGILKECEQIGDKVLVFSQSLYSLTLIEEFLRRIDDETQKNSQLESLDNHTGSWSLGLDYFRLDGQTSPDNRSAWCRIFNRPTNTRARLFLISTRAGGLGINLTAANRVIIFDASWNPSHDVQSIFRIYRFGQKKPCYVYRFLAARTMEEKIYNRQVTKLSLSCRVVDEQQIERHYSNHDLNELYMFEPYDTEKPTLNLPKDRLLAEIFLKYKDVVENYHEHDSLLENKAEEELDEEERKQAWLEYEEEKKGKPAAIIYQNNIFQQQYNIMMNAEQAGISPQNFSVQSQYENLQQLIRKDYPNATLEQQKLMTNRTLMEMYNYWERQALLQPVRNPVVLPTYQPRIPSLQATTSGNPRQLNQMVTGQPVNYMNVNQSPQSGVNLLQKQFAYRNVSANNTGKRNDDIIEITPSTSNVGALNAQVVQPAATNKNQEE